MGAQGTQAYAYLESIGVQAIQHVRAAITLKQGHANHE